MKKHGNFCFNYRSTKVTEESRRRKTIRDSITVNQFLNALANRVIK